MKFKSVVKWKCFASYKEKFWVWVTPLVGRHVVNGTKVGCYVVNELKAFFKSDARWIIHLRLYSGPLGCRVPGWTKSDIENIFKVFQSNDTRV